MRALLVLIAVFPTAWARAQVVAESFRVEEIATPTGMTSTEASAVAVDGDGRLWATFRRGSVQVYDLVARRWHKFADGLQEPLGLVFGKTGEIFVLQRPELTRIVDENGDGTADLYETVADGWGLSGNYHEYAYGPVRDATGNFYISLGLASNGAEPRPPLRGQLSTAGRKSLIPREGQANITQHYSPVPYRGCVLQIGRGGEVRFLASGLRQPSGIAMSPADDLFVTDNQGDWIGTSPLHHVTPGAFFGHPASLKWDPAWRGPDPIDLPVSALAARRKPPAVQFPHNDIANSIGQPVFVPDGFGAYAGQIVFGDWATPRILRVDLEKIEGEYQGAAFILFENNGLRRANHRLAFSHDGKALYVAQRGQPWAWVGGLQRITWTGRPPLDIATMRLRPGGFELTFTGPIDPVSGRSPESYGITRYRYLYHSAYGSPKTDLAIVKVTAARPSPDGRRVDLEVDGLIPGMIYELKPSGLKGTDGQPLRTRLAAYTANRLIAAAAVRAEAKR